MEKIRSVNLIFKEQIANMRNKEERQKRREAKEIRSDEWFEKNGNKLVNATIILNSIAIVIGIVAIIISISRLANLG